MSRKIKNRRGEYVKYSIHDPFSMICGKFNRTKVFNNLGARYIYLFFQERVPPMPLSTKIKSYIPFTRLSRESRPFRKEYKRNNNLYRNIHNCAKLNAPLSRRSYYMEGFTDLSNWGRIK